MSGPEGRALALTKRAGRKVRGLSPPKRRRREGRVGIHCVEFVRLMIL
jgi:hypothetical protein